MRFHVLVCMGHIRRLVSTLTLECLYIEGTKTYPWGVHVTYLHPPPTLVVVCDKNRQNQCVD